MASEPLISKLRHGFPKEAVNGRSYRTDLEYVGLETYLRLHSPNISTVWGEYNGVVTDATIEPIEGSLWAILKVIVEASFEPGDVGEKRETSYETDWADVQKVIINHREFMTGGAYPLTDEDLVDIDRWRSETNATRKSTYQYTLVEGEDTEGGPTKALSTNAKMCARGYLLGVEYFVFKSPIARKTESYVNGPPPDGVAGLKDDPTGFPNLPEGYEWLRNADRGLRAGGQSRWTRDIEWLGADKILIDAEGIFWDPPA